MKEISFICVCGKDFKSQKSLSAHQGGCKIYYQTKYGDLSVYDNRIRKLSKTQHDYAQTDKFYKRIETQRKEALKKKQQQLTQWISEQHICEKCGKVMTEYFGSGRFCSRGCANSRKHSVETIEKIKASSNRKPPKYCKTCGKKLNNRNISGFCSSCFIPTSTDESRRKQSETMRLRKRGRWNISRDKMSYAEQFFARVLQQNNIVYQQECPIKNDNTGNYYFLDFYVNKNNKKIDLEIDGRQHLLEKQVQHDAKRDSYLRGKGFIVYRIKWFNIRGEAGKKKIDRIVSSFLSFYNSL